MTRTARAFFFAVIIVLLAGGAALCQQKNAGRAARQRFVAAGRQDSMSFDPAVLYDSGGSGAASVVIADINGDGKPDLIVVNNWNCGSGECATNGGVGVLLGNGDGTFGPTVNYSSGGGYAVSVAVADFNHDGKPDLVVANYNSGSIGVLLGNGDGTFQPVVVYALAGGTYLAPQTVSVADVNGDGNPDLAVVLFGSQVNVFMGNGDGTFQAPVVYENGCCNRSSLTIADVNGDGKPDLLLVFAFCNGCQNSDGQVGVMLNNGDGTFQPEVLYDSGGDYPASVVAADVNGDGKTDLVVANSCSVLNDGFCTGAGSISVLQGNGDGTFQAAVDYGFGGLSYSSVVAADLNGDGKVDLAATGCTSTGIEGYCSGPGDGSVMIWIGNGDGTFQAGTPLDAGGAFPTSLAVVDLNGDGKPDLVVSLSYGYRSGADGSAGVLLNASGTPPPTTTSLTSSANPCLKPCLVTFTATVTSSAGTPTGTVVFYNGTTALGSAVLAGGIATLKNPGFHHGTYPITAVYQGSSSFAGSTSPILYQVVHELVYATSTSLETSRTPILVGQSVTFFASVAARYDGSSPPDGELIYFSDNHGTELGSVPMQGGSASVTTSALIAAKHTIIARYNGDGVYGKSHGLLTQIVDKYSSSTTLTSSLNPAVYGQPITYTVTVASSAPGGATGRVTLTGMGSLPLVGGVATITKTEVRVGTHSLTAEYKGDDESLQSTSSVLEEVVNPASTTTVLTSSANPSSSGQTVTFTATVTSSTGVDPFGKVTFTAGTTTLGTVALKDGTASVSTAALPVGSTAITAAYGGADGFTGSSVSITQVVQ